MRSNRLAWILLLLLLPVAAFAGDEVSLLEAGACNALSSPAATADGAPLEGPLDDVLWLSDCTADCGEYMDRSCSDSNTCTAVNRDCSVLQRGYVECDGSKYYCGPECPDPVGDCLEEYNRCVDSCFTLDCIRACSSILPCA